jgi:hypothetical protein
MWLVQMLICLTLEPIAIPASPVEDSLLSISQAQGRQPPSEPRPTFRDFERRPMTLSEEEFEQLKRSVMSRCRVAAGTESAKAPWYFHYELGLELAKRGDPQRALDALIEALDRRAVSSHGARMYGVWFIDYLPYIHIANLHAQLGNWSCAADALRLSEQSREISPTDDEYRFLILLRQELEQHRPPK